MGYLLLTDVFVNKGFNDNPAIKFADSGKAAFFQVSERVYDKKAENEHRYINYDIKVFDSLIDRIKKMGLKEGSRVHLVGRMDEETWQEDGTNKTRRKKVVILENIDYGYLPKDNGNGNGNGGGQSSGGQNGNANGGGQNQNGYGNPGMGAAPPQYGQPPQYPQGAMPPYQQPMPQQGQMPQNFTGYAPYDPNGNGGNPYFNNQG